MENDFCFKLKILFVYKIFTFLSRTFGCVEKWIDEKAKVKFKIDDVTYWIIMNYNIYIYIYIYIYICICIYICIYILPNISRSKGNQTMKLGQLIEHNMINIFLKKSYTKYGGNGSPSAFY